MTKLNCSIDCLKLSITAHGNESCTGSTCCNVGGDSGGSGGNDGTVANLMGDIRLLPYSSDSLPTGWYFCNGDRYNMNDTVGASLFKLDDAFKQNWNIVSDASHINVPNLFSDDGRGMFLRSVSGQITPPLEEDGTQPPSVGRNVGSVEGDAIRNITGGWQPSVTDGMIRDTNNDSNAATGAFKRGSPRNRRSPYSQTDSVHTVAFDASLAVPTSYDNHPLNIGMTPAIFLGV